MTEQVRNSQTEQVRNSQYVINALEDRLMNSMHKNQTVAHEFRKDDLEYLERTYANMAKNHTTKAWKHSVSFISAIVGIIGAGFGKDAKVGNILTGIGQAGQQLGQFTLNFSDSEQSRLQGMMEQLREAIQQDNKNDQEVQRLLHDIETILNQASERAAKAHASPWHS